MRVTFWVLARGAVLATFIAACSASSSSNGSSSGGGSVGKGGGGGSGGSTSACPPCLGDSDCAGGAKCAQFAGDSYCAPDCSNGAACSSDRACTTVPSAAGDQIQVCIPIANVCGSGSGGSGGAGGAAGAPAGGGSGGTTDVCGTLDGPSVKACCSSCGAGQTCQPNGCYNGWWCNTQTCKCQPPPPSPCNGGGGSGGTGGTGGTVGTGGNGGSVTGIDGGKLDNLSFTVVGDTRPPTDDDTAGYPTGVITKIWQDVQAQNPLPAFGISTGDYMFAKAYGNQSGPQLDIYLGARAVFSNVVFPAMGNHECTGQTASNCGSGNADGITKNYTSFMSKMLSPLGVTSPYYTVNIGSNNGTWTAKIVFIAANAWDAAQSNWLNAALAAPTTYTFVVRHEGSTATTAPGVTPSANLLSKYPYTMLIAGHTHTFEYFKSEKQMIVGNGGAPLSSNVNYGYVVARQRADGAIEFKEYDYATNAVNQTFAVKADGSPTP